MYADTLVKDIDRLLRDLKTEETRLEAAKAALVNGHVPVRRPPGRSKGTRTKRARVTAQAR